MLHSPDAEEVKRPILRDFVGFFSDMTGNRNPSDTSLEKLLKFGAARLAQVPPAQAGCSTNGVPRPAAESKPRFY
jgi:hypothetical protein